MSNVQVVLYLKGNKYLCLLVLLQTLAVIRGADYINGESHESTRLLSSVELAAPLWFWGVVFMASGCIGMVSVAYRSWYGTILSHALISASYCTISFGIIIDVIEDAALPQGGANWYIFLPLIVLFAIFGPAYRGGQGARIAGIFALIAFVLSVVTIELDGLRSATALLGLGIINFLFSMSMAQNKARHEIFIRKQEEKDANTR